MARFRRNMSVEEYLKKQTKRTPHWPYISQRRKPLLIPLVVLIIAIIACICLSGCVSDMVPPSRIDLEETRAELLETRITVNQMAGKLMGGTPTAYKAATEANNFEIVQENPFAELIEMGVNAGVVALGLGGTGIGGLILHGKRKKWKAEDPNTNPYKIT